MRGMLKNGPSIGFYQNHHIFTFFGHPGAPKDYKLCRPLFIFEGSESDFRESFLSRDHFLGRSVMEKVMCV